MIEATEEPDGSSIGAMKKMSLQILSICEYADAKIGLADIMVALFNEYQASETALTGVVNKTIREDISKEDALKQIDKVIQKNGQLTESLVTFYNKEPSQGPYEGLLTLFGVNAFNNEVNNAAINTCMTEAGEQDIQVVLRANNALEGRTDIPMLEDGYTNTMNLFTQVKNLRNEDEDVAKQVKRLARHLNQDVTHLKEEIYGSDELEMTPSVIKDLVDQIGELKKRFTTLVNLSDRAPPLDVVEVTYGDSPFECSVQEFFAKARRMLLTKKDEIQD